MRRSLGLAVGKLAPFPIRAVALRKELFALLLLIVFRHMLFAAKLLSAMSERATISIRTAAGFPIPAHLCFVLQSEVKAIGWLAWWSYKAVAGFFNSIGLEVVRHKYYLFEMADRLI